MKKQKRPNLNKPEDFDTLCSIWIIACNDENPIITYEGITYRLNLPDKYDIRGLVKCHGELFRRSVPKRRLDEWKIEMRQNRHLPSWIRDEEPTKRPELIEALSPDDVFRSQFRAENDAPKSSIEIVDWGLRHIERLKDAQLEAREGIAKSWQMWLVFIVGLLNIFATVISAWIGK